MKQIEFKTSKGDFVVIKLPKKAKHIELAKDSKGVYLCWHDGNDSLINDDFSHGEIILSKNTRDSFKLISKMSNITEEQASDILGDVSIIDEGILRYKDFEDDDNKYVCIADSLYSLLYHHGVVFENTPCNNCQNGCPVCSGLGNLQDSWDKSQTYIFAITK